MDEGPGGDDQSRAADPPTDDQPEGGRIEWRGDQVWLHLDAATRTTRPAALGLELGGLATAFRRQGAGAIHWPVDFPTPADDAAAAAAGLTEQRDLHQLRRPLPVERSTSSRAPAIATRPFRPGTADEPAWVDVNNRAFARHPDQGHETIETLHARLAEPRFDPQGFLLLDGTPRVDAGGRLDGFCWTKVHPASATEPALGEIYVIAVHPDAAGRGLGAALVLAGLAHLHELGLTTGMLYVDADNTPALELYARLGFTRHHIHRVYSTP